MSTYKLIHLHTLPEREEDNGFDEEELENWVVLREKLLGGSIEHHESIQGHRHRQVVGNGAVQVAMAWARQHIHEIITLSMCYI